MSSKKNVHEYKKKSVSELAKLIKEKKTILIASIKDIPASQFQEIGKKLRGKAVVKVPKKNLIFRAIDSSENETVKKLKENIGDSVAVLFSDLDTFELAGELVKSTTPAKAKAGQEAPHDIEVEAGGTELVPGPAITELGAVGIQIQIEKGKIHIKESRVIVKKGAKISRAAADIMGKLDIKPFKVGFIPLAGFDTKEGKLYLDIKIDREGTLEKLKEAHNRALLFAIEIGYPSKDTIKFLLGKGYAHGKTLEKFKEERSKEVKEEKTEDSEGKKQENIQEDKQEKKENVE